MFMFMNFVSFIDRQFDVKIKKIQSDNDTKFNYLCDFSSKNEIVFETSYVGTPQQNERVEIKHQHIMDVIMTLKFLDNLLMNFWVECVSNMLFN